MDKIAVLIPCYNESKTVEKVVSDFRRVLPDATVYVYDNNSTDGTAELAAGAGAVVRHEYQQGKAMSCAACSARSTQRRTFLWTATTPTPLRPPPRW